MRHKVCATTVLANDIERTEREDPHAFYEGKISTIRWMQQNGSSDEMIERLLGVRLHPEHRQRQRQLMAAE